ncbi:N-acetyltransferase family protein [Mucilaginibacter mali]|uniref:N-acetyltransferase family protein n=1 Tax=Mucilaginibacter mali TaxID=2740462 RepID=A0A7D4QE93_9SPHI|nr:GNAT family N-acetyltransferase [Mucilaginibacter mali]QKJ29532.1 N-acetyltransferase family protein [Mucilaginibacter mali]
METSFIIRHANASDLPAILEIYNHAIIHTTAVYQDDVHTLAMREQWFADKLKLGHPVFVAAEAGKVTGFSTYGPFRNWPGYRFTVEHSVYVDTGSRGKGVGKMLVQAVINHARDKGMHALIAGIDSSSAGSLHLHQSLGFTEVAHFKQVGFKFGRWLDLKFLELLLNENI